MASSEHHMQKLQGFEVSFVGDLETITDVKCPDSVHFP
jgi:hypothetical protein